MKTLCSLLCLTIAFGCGPTFAADTDKTTKTETKTDTKTTTKTDATATKSDTKTATKSDTKTSTKTDATATKSDKTATKSDAKTATKTETKSDTKTVTAKVSKEKAQEAAMKVCPGELLCWDLQIEDGIPEYAFYIKGKDGRISEAEMDGNTGKKTNIGVLIESKGNDGKTIKTTNDKDLARLKQPKLTREQTQEKALKQYAGTVDAWELLLWEHGKEGKLVFDFRIKGKDGMKVVTIDSTDGSLVSISKFVKGEGR